MTLINPGSVSMFTVPALSEKVEVVIERGLRIRGGSNEMKMLFLCMAVFFYSVVSIKLNTDLCTNTVQAINSEWKSCI